jgi:hypothetical protein
VTPEASPRGKSTITTHNKKIHQFNFKGYYVLISPEILKGMSRESGKSEEMPMTPVSKQRTWKEL